MRARSAVLAAGLLAGLLVAPAAHAGDGDADPTRPGAHSVTRIEYDAGPTLLNVDPANGAPVLADLHGEVFLPSGRGPFPVLLFQHGRHATCRYAGVEELGHPCPRTAITEPVDSYRGYDYLASSLAGQGYLVVSVDANGVNSYDLADVDAGARARAELISRSLDLIGGWSGTTGPDGVGDRLRGRVDLKRLGLMGHSRGGEGVTYWLNYNARRTDGPRYRVSAVLALAPIDFTSQLIPDVPWATLLPRCDGDVYDMEGARAFERNKYSLVGRRSPLFQWVVEGANHNWFNTTWTSDDARTSDPICNPKGADSGRLTRVQQRRVGLVYIGAFLRRYVGGERRFDGLLTGRAGHQRACSQDMALPCRALVHTSYLPPAGLRTTLLRPRVDDIGEFRPEAGSQLSQSGDVTVRGCDTTRSAIACPRQPQGTSSKPGYSSGPQLTVQWTGRGALTVTAASTWAARRSDELVVRLAANAGANREGSPQRAGTNSVPFQLVLTDRDGRRAAVEVTSRYDAPEPPPGRATRVLLLSDVRVPLSAFDGLSLGALRTVSLVFGQRRLNGSLQLADLALQRG